MYTMAMSRFFKFLTHHEELFKSQGEELTYKKGQMLVWRKESSDWVYFLKSGTVKAAFTLQDGTERILGYFIPGMTFAQMGSFFADPSATLEYEAISTVQVYRLPRTVFLDAVANMPEINKEYVDQILRGQIALIERIEYQGEKGIKGKLVKWLLFMQKYYCSSEAKSCTFDIPLTHETVANFLHATRESVSKNINQLRRDGYITVKAKHITINDIDKLRKYSESL